MKGLVFVRAGVAASAALLLTAPARSQQPAAAPPEFAVCAACHATDDSNGTGPSLKGIVGRTSGTFPGFRYSRAMKVAAIAWDADKLERYLVDPQALVPGNLMPLSGVAEAAERAKIIAYLATLR